MQRIAEVADSARGGRVRNPKGPGLRVWEPCTPALPAVRLLACAGLVGMKRMRLEFVRGSQPGTIAGTHGPVPNSAGVT